MDVVLMVVVFCGLTGFFDALCSLTWLFCFVACVLAFNTRGRKKGRT